MSAFENRTPRRAARTRVDCHEVAPLTLGWQAACCAPGSHEAPERLDGLDWVAASVPGTAAGALRHAGSMGAAGERDFDAEDWWFRTSFRSSPAQEGEELVLCMDGLATVAEVYLNGQRILESESMFLAHELDIGALVGAENELSIRCRALAPLLALRRGPRARWRTRLVADGRLRFFRTMIMGRAPGFAPGPAPVGPWRGVRIERRRRVAVDQLTLRTRTGEQHASTTVRALLRGLEPDLPCSVELELSSEQGAWRAPLSLTPGAGGLHVSGELTMPEVEHWWPHTHGDPALYHARLLIEGRSWHSGAELGRVGFRSLSFGSGSEHSVEREGLELELNGVSVFARGAVWTPIDPVGLAPGAGALRVALEQVRDAGMNMLRIPGTSAYESEAFHELCDELGILVWQDFMFANLDYPISDEPFRALVAREARQVLDELAGRPSLAVLCGNSEVEQQVAMLGLDPALGRGELFGELLPGLVAESDGDALYIPSAPCGGELPFRTDQGIANYYGVGGYRRPVADVRRAEVRFAAECLAFSNVPDEATIEQMLPSPGAIVAHDPRWKAGVPRDVGAGWDFEDVRDHYLARLFEIDPAETRRVEHERYLELSRMVSGELMGEVFGEWRRARSPCAGALVLWMRDLLPGAGWGVIDHRGEPKVAYHHLRRALAPIATWLVDEGLNGVRVHVANDRPYPLHGSLRLALYRDYEQLVGEVSQQIQLAAHSSREWDLESLLGRFVDASWSYRFGPPAQGLIVASLARGEADSRSGEGLLSQASFLPGGRPLQREAPSRLGLRATVAPADEGGMQLSVSATRFAYGVRVNVPGFRACEDAFSVEPGGGLCVALSPREDGQGSPASFQGGWLSAVNMHGRAPISLQEGEALTGGLAAPAFRERAG